MQEFSVRCKQAGIDQRLPIEKINVVGDQALQKFPAIRPRYSDQAPVFQFCEKALLCHDLPCHEYDPGL